VRPSSSAPSRARTPSPGARRGSSSRRRALPPAGTPACVRGALGDGFRRGAAAGFAAALGGLLRVPRQRGVRRRRSRCPFERLLRSPCASRVRRLSRSRAVSRRPFLHAFARGGAGRSVHPGAARFGQADRDGLLCVLRPVLALANMVHLLANELASGRGRGLALGQVASRSSFRALLRHAGVLKQFSYQAIIGPVRSRTPEDAWHPVAAAACAPRPAARTRRTRSPIGA
jgi:hypothetical protein